MDDATLPESFVRKLEALEARLGEEEFTILVWGSGRSSPVDYEKRLRVRDHLRERFGDGRVFLSEDPALQPYVERLGLGTAEALQARAVDAVVILDTSIGAHTELTKYGSLLLGKTIVFASDAVKASGGFASVAFDVLKTEYYTDEEYRECHEIRRRANDFCQGLRMMRAQPDRLARVLGTI